MTAHSDAAPDGHRARHSPEAIRKRLLAGPKRSYLRDFVYGAIDGTVTTFAIVSGVAGADLSSHIVLILGLANVVGDGFSMAAGNFLGVRAEQQQREAARRAEEREIALYPAGEREEIRQILAKKGFADDNLDRAVDVITSDRRQWVEMMLTDELGLSREHGSAWRAALATFSAFLLLGMVPLLPFAVQFVLGRSIENPYPASVLLTAVAFFGIGAAKSRFVEERWYAAGFETLIVGGSAAGLAYIIGVALKGLAGADGA